ncbi:MAG: GntR family transcription regulator [Amycolatopsis sp.]|nr:GntR family transcription regulator [Amycolatopsis sp.]
MSTEKLKTAESSSRRYPEFVGDAIQPIAELSTNTPFRNGIPEDGRIPQYFQAKLLIAAIIGQLGVGVPIPTERSLAARLGMARETIRNATEELIVEGKLLRKHGSGTYVAPPKVTDAITPASADGDNWSHGAKSRSFLFSENIVADRTLADDLGIRARSTVVHIEQLLTETDTPVGLESTYIPNSLFRVADNLRIAPMSVRRRLLEQCDITASRVDNRIESILATPREAKLLQVPPGLPTLMVDRSWFSEKQLGDKPKLVARSRTIYRADRTIVTSSVDIDSE